MTKKKEHIWQFTNAQAKAIFAGCLIIVLMAIAIIFLSPSPHKVSKPGLIPNTLYLNTSLYPLSGASKLIYSYGYMAFAPVFETYHTTEFNNSLTGTSCISGLYTYDTNVIKKAYFNYTTQIWYNESSIEYENYVSFNQVLIVYNSIPQTSAIIVADSNINGSYWWHGGSMINNLISIPANYTLLCPWFYNQN